MRGVTPFYHLRGRVRKRRCHSAGALPNENVNRYGPPNKKGDRERERRKQRAREGKKDWRWIRAKHTSVRNLYSGSREARRAWSATRRAGQRNVMLIAVIGFGRNAVLTRPDNVLTSIMYTSVTRAAGAHIIMAVHTWKQKRSPLMGRGSGAIKCSCQRLICLQSTRGALAFG